MSHHPKPSRKKKGKNKPVTHYDIERAIQAFKERSGLIKRLPDERVTARRNVRVNFMLSSPYENVSGVDISHVPF